MGFCNFRGRTTEPLNGGTRPKQLAASREPFIWVAIGLPVDRACAVHFARNTELSKTSLENNDLQ